MNVINVLVVVAFLERVFGETDYQICVNKSTPVRTDEQRLHMTLMAGYHKHIRPVLNASDVVNVTIEISLTRIVEVDETKQTLTTTALLHQEWWDKKLKWNPDEYGGLTDIRLPCTEIWKPDITLYNSADVFTSACIDSLAVVHNEGYVLWMPVVKLSSTCPMDHTYFPFDNQICNITMGSWVYNGNQVDLYVRKGYTFDYMQNSEWDLINVNAKRNSKMYACCPEIYPDATFTIHIRRKTPYYSYNVFIPCVMLSILSLLVFWMSPESGEKVTLGVTVLLAFAVFTLHIGGNIPATSCHVHLLGIYLTWMMSVTSLSVIMAVTVSKMSECGRRYTPVPLWLRQVVILLSRIMCKRLYFVKINSDRAAVFPWEQSEKQSGAENSGLKEFVHERASEQGRDDASNARKERHECEEIVTRLKELILRSRENTDHRASGEWKEVSEVIDRFMFWMLLVVSVVMTLTLLVIVPSSKNT